MIVTDLDGTLLDHRNYSYEAALPALEKVKAARIPLVLASSKTEAEIMVLHQELDLGDVPAIVENGAGVVTPGERSSPSVDVYNSIRRALDDVLPRLRRAFDGFGDMDPKDIAAQTGLTDAAAELARERQFSEPGLWTGTDSELLELQEVLASSGIAARFGGRFLTLSMGHTKADAVRDVAASLERDFVVALGDAPNDIEMIELADIGVIVRNDHGTQIEMLPGETTGQIRRTNREGPAGWNAAVLQILTELEGL
ncbi:MAG: HAD-IIB family hydrolase [Pseudomonadota bacterium]